MNHLPDDLLNEYLDEALAPGLRTESEAHLAACESCSARLGELRALFAGLDTLPDLPLETDFVPLVVARLESNAPLPRPIRWLAIFQVLGATLAASLAWPLVEPLLPPMEFSSLRATFAELAAVWLQAGLDIQFSKPVFELPTFSLDLPTTTLITAILGTALFWLVANGLLLIPRSRRTP